MISKMFIKVMINSKKILKFIIYFSKSLFRLDKLSNQEIEGKWNKITLIKFISRTAIKVPFSNGRSIRGLAFDNNLTKDPFFNIIDDISKNKTFVETRDNFFEQLNYESKLSLADVVHCERNKILSQYPPWSCVLPWDKRSIEEKYKTYENLQKITRLKKAKQYKFESKILNKDYLYSIEMAESQVLQFSILYNNIIKNGYKEHNNLPSFFILIKNNKWKWFMSEGNHRAYILHKLNEKFMYGSIVAVLNRIDAPLWPNVINGLYSKEEACRIFDLIFEGKISMSPII